ncbi:MAG: hypothetical protein GX601_14545 [Anaerolineales bacterium]|nr:hypothetical protein [Anaerolineales bacterium]
MLHNLFRAESVGVDYNMCVAARMLQSPQLLIPPIWVGLQDRAPLECFSERHFEVDEHVRLREVLPQRGYERVFLGNLPHSEPLAAQRTRERGLP